MAAAPPAEGVSNTFSLFVLVFTENSSWTDFSSDRAERVGYLNEDEGGGGRRMRGMRGKDGVKEGNEGREEEGRKKGEGRRKKEEGG